MTPDESNVNVPLFSPGVAVVGLMKYEILIGEFDGMLAVNWTAGGGPAATLKSAGDVYSVPDALYTFTLAGRIS
jgi:hypothetical protein